VRTPPSSVTKSPLTACVEPYSDVQGCVDELWIKAGLGHELNFMHAVVQCESSWQPWAQGDWGWWAGVYQGRAKGLFQLRIDAHYARRSPDWWASGQWANPGENTKLALELRKASGWGPWSCSR